MQRFATLALAVTFMLGAASANASVIFVNDAPNDGNGTRRVPVAGDGVIWPGIVSQTFDLSTDGDSAAGLSGTLELTHITGWYETGSMSTNFNDDYAGELNGTGKFAIWTATGYAPGVSVDVYATWRNQGNFAAAAPWSINGVAAVALSMRVAPVNDLELDDPAGGTEGFQFIGTGTADGSGQVEVRVEASAGAGGYTNIDAVAFKSDVVPEPATLALLSIGGLGLLIRRRRVRG